MWACFWNHFWTPLKNGSGHFFIIWGVTKWVQKGDFILVLGGHGAPWVPKSAFGPESCISRPPKVTPRSDNRLKKTAKVADKMFPNLARRTARSGLNNGEHIDGCFPNIIGFLKRINVCSFLYIWGKQDFGAIHAPRTNETWPCEF